MHTKKSVRGQKKRSRIDDSMKEGLTNCATEDSTDSTSYSTASSSDDEDQDRVQGISSLLNAAAHLEGPTGASMSRLTAKLSENASITDKSDSAELRKTMAGITTLLEVATTLVERDETCSNSVSNLARSENKGENRAVRNLEEDVTTRPKKRLALMAGRQIPPGEEMLYPTEAELEEATTRRSRNALFSWYDRLRDLYAYKVKHGDCMVPQKYPENHALGIWVNKQRMEKRLRDQGLKSTLTEDRLKLLDKLGFHWAKHKGQVSWDQKYDELRDFHREHGHCNVPTKFRDNSALGRWVSTQRAQLKEWKRGEKTSMTQERYEKLCALDFQFERLASCHKRSDDSNSRIDEDDYDDENYEEDVMGSEDEFRKKE